MTLSFKSLFDLERLVPIMVGFGGILFIFYSISPHLCVFFCLSREPGFEDMGPVEQRQGLEGIFSEL